MNHSLFNEFHKVSSKAWKQKIQFDLKGEDYNETLIWESNEGIKVKPFYHQDEFEALAIPKENRDSAICQSIFISDEQTANFLAKDALKKGAVRIVFEAKATFNIALLLDNLGTKIKGKPLQIFFKLHFLSPSFLKELTNQTSEYLIFLNIDMIGNFAKNGNWFKSEIEDFNVLEQLFTTNKVHVNLLGVDMGLYQNAGANCVQQIAYGLAHANEYLNLIENLETKSTKSTQSIQFSMSVGGNYFFEIAKIRAFRYLWNLLSEEYDYKLKAHLFVEPSIRNKTIYDYNVNMLRSTSECMSALLGGADTVLNKAYDTVYHKKNEFGERIARNQLLILQNESYFKEASQFVDGAYYIEALTKQLAEKALSLFKDIEQSGGFLKQLTTGKIQHKIEETAAKEQAQFNKGARTLVGTNTHINADDRMKDIVALYPFVKANPRKTTIQPIIPKRLAQKLEQERLASE